jgi:hypothetical protein
MLGRQKSRAVINQCELRAHHECIDETAQQHQNRHDDIHHADFLVINGRQPFTPEIAPLLEVAQREDDGEHDDGHERGRHHDDRLIERYVRQR